MILIFPLFWFQLYILFQMVVENTTNISGRTTCETDSCLNGGICSSSLNNEIECLCPDEFTGPRCAENSTATSPSFSTSVSSSVSSSVRSSVSSSSSASVGSSCESEPCRNNGSCTDLIDGGYDCLCSPGFGKIYFKTLHLYNTKRIISM